MADNTVERIISGDQTGVDRRVTFTWYQDAKSGQVGSSAFLYIAH